MKKGSNILSNRPCSKSTNSLSNLSSRKHRNDFSICTHTAISTFGDAFSSPKRHSRYSVSVTEFSIGAISFKCHLLQSPQTQVAIKKFNAPMAA